MQALDEALGDGGIFVHSDDSADEDIDDERRRRSTQEGKRNSFLMELETDGFLEGGVLDAHDARDGAPVASYRDMTEHIDQYFESIDNQNCKCRWASYVTFFVVAVLIALLFVMHVMISQKNYQRSDPVIGTTNVRVLGATTSAAGKVFDACDLVVPAREKDALFVTSGFFKATTQMRWEDPAETKHKVCAGMAECACKDSEAMCAECKDDAGLDNDGLRTGRCVPMGGAGGGDEKRCEVKAWCPVMEVDRRSRMDEKASEDATGQYELTNVENLVVKLSVRAKGDIGGDGNVSHAFDFFTNMTVGDMLERAGSSYNETQSTGALLYVSPVCVWRCLALSGVGGGELGGSGWGVASNASAIAGSVCLSVCVSLGVPVGCVGAHSPLLTGTPCVCVCVCIPHI
jgi:hypothetical protein